MSKDSQLTERASFYIRCAISTVTQAAEGLFDTRTNISLVGKAKRNLTLAEACLQIALEEENESKK